MVDGTIIPIQPIVAWHTGAFNKPMTMMNGAREGRGKLFNSPYSRMFESPRMPLTAAQYEAAINATYTAPTLYRPVYHIRPGLLPRFWLTTR